MGIGYWPEEAEGAGASFLPQIKNQQSTIINRPSIEPLRSDRAIILRSFAGQRRGARCSRVDEWLKQRQVSGEYGHCTMVSDILSVPMSCVSMSWSETQSFAIFSKDCIITIKNHVNYAPVFIIITSINKYLIFSISVF